jgi:hypothetical protein
MDVYLVLFDRDAVYIGDKIFSSITKYIDDNYIPKAYESRVAEKQRVDARRRLLKSEKNSNLNKFSSDVNDEFMDNASLISEAPVINKSLEGLIMNLDESFSLTLMRLIDARGKTDVEVYKKANIDRKLFSKIRSNEDYRPSKNTVLAFAIALELSLKETNQLLEKAGFALSHCSRFDIIIEYFINKGSYDIYEINQTLFQFDQPTLGA